MTNTPRLSAPYLQAAQAQKHVTVNESLRLFDVLVQAVAINFTSTAPPGAPNEGDAYVIAATATGDWAGLETQIAAWQDGAWAYHIPAEGWQIYDRDTDALMLFDGTAWGAFSGGISGDSVPQWGINTSPDSYNRIAVKTDGGYFSHDDVSGSGTGDVRIDYNKAAASNTGAFLFKTNWTAHAEIGLAGDNKLRAKVSPDGSTWFTAWEIDETTGEVTFPNTTLGGGVMPTAPTDMDDTDSNYIYSGYQDYPASGAWVIIRQLKALPNTRTTVTTGAADYASAWAARTTLTYA